MDYAANVASFLMNKTGSTLKVWSGHMSAAEQRELFGRFLGKGKLWIDGAEETIEHYRKVCFGTDAECTKRLAWREL